MAKTTRTHLPGEITFSEAGGAGIVLGAHCAFKSWKLTTDNKTITSIKDFAEYGEYEMRTSKKRTLEVTLEAPSIEIQALLSGGDIIVADYVGHFSELIGPAVAGVFPALTDVPILANSEVIRKCDITGKTISDRLVNVAAGAVAGQYTIVPATGVVTVEAGYTGYAIVNYAGYNAATGIMLVSDDSVDIDPMDIIIIERAWEPVLGQKGTRVIKMEGCELIKEADDGGDMEAINPWTYRFNCPNTVRKAVYTA